MPVSAQIQRNGIKVIRLCCTAAERRSQPQRTNRWNLRFTYSTYGIKAYVEGLEKGIATTPQIQKKYVDTIKNKTVELERIINQLFMFSKIDIGEFPFNLEKVNVSKELESFINNISEEYEKKKFNNFVYYYRKRNIYKC